MLWFEDDGGATDLMFLECDRCGTQTEKRREPYNVQHWYAAGWRVFGREAMTGEDTHLCPVCAWHWRFAPCTMADFDVAVRRARAARAKAIRRAGAWIADRWLGLAWFAALLALLAAFHGEWIARLWLDVIR